MKQELNVMKQMRQILENDESRTVLQMQKKKEEEKFNREMEYFKRKNIMGYQNAKKLYSKGLSINKFEKFEEVMYNLHDK